MAKAPNDFDAWAEEEAARRRAEDTAEAQQRREAKRKAETEREIRQGLRDANGDWIEQPETDDEDDHETDDEV